MSQQDPIRGLPRLPQPVMPYHTPTLNPHGTVCPKCGSPHSKKVSFTWWGGVLGPKLFSHVKCLACGAGYNSKTGKSNTTPITIYVVISGIIGILVFVYFAFRFTMA